MCESAPWPLTKDFAPAVVPLQPRQMQHAFAFGGEILLLPTRGPAACVETHYTLASCIHTAYAAYTSCCLSAPFAVLTPFLRVDAVVAYAPVCAIGGASAYTYPVDESEVNLGSSLRAEYPLQSSNARSGLHPCRSILNDTYIGIFSSREPLHLPSFESTARAVNKTQPRLDEQLPPQPAAEITSSLRYPRLGGCSSGS